jgi:GTP-binding protein
MSEMKPFTAEGGKPTVAIVGRPNVGKSTLFNRLTRSRDALVADVPGLTRDPKVGIGRVGEAGYIVVDTGGIDGEQEDELSHQVSAQALSAARLCDAVIGMVDGRAGINASDEEIVKTLREGGTRAVLCVNKAEGRETNLALAEFASLGLKQGYAISAAHGDGVTAMIEDLTAEWPSRDSYEQENRGERVRITVIGRPNVGKSTLVNRILGEDRMITSNVPGTTRDAVDSDFERRGRAYTIIDTAGLRKRGRTHGLEEKFSAIQTLNALERTQIALLLIDAHDGLIEQDLHLLGMVLDSGRALVVVVNKWDGLSVDQREHIQREIDRRLRFADFAEVRCISALHGSGVGDLFSAIDAAWESAFAAPRTHDLTELLQVATTAHPPPMVHGRRIKMRYAHLGGRNPPTIVIHGNQVDGVPNSYKRYLENFFRDKLDLVGTPIQLEFRQGANPYAGRRNTLNQRQQDKRRRLMSHVKKKK